MDAVDDSDGRAQAEVKLDRGVDPPVVSLSGEFDLVTETAIEEILGPLVDEMPGAVIVLDMSEVTFIDSSGLKPLLRANARGASLRLRNPSLTVRTVVSTAGLDGTFPVEE